MSSDEQVRAGEEAEMVIVREIVAFLRLEAGMARYAQGNAEISSPDKLYRMGQKDGLLLAADAIERAALTRAGAKQ